MKKTIICNAVPVYPEAPAAVNLLNEKLEIVIKILAETEAEKRYLIIDKKEEALIAKAKASVTETAAAVEIVETEVQAGFVYGNATALEKVTEGEKPIPSGTTSETAVCTVEELLDSGEKKIYLQYGEKQIEAHQTAKALQVKELLELTGEPEKAKAIYLGYPAGQFISVADTEKELVITTDYIRVIDEAECILDVLAGIMNRFHKESCGRCIFGHEGVTQIAMILSDIVQKKGKPGDIELLTDLCTEMYDQVLCEVGQAAAKTVLTALSYFRDEIEAHILKKTCKAGVCSKFVTYHILADKCKGCNECQDECEDDAILGKKRFVHVIDQDECIQCGKCMAICEYGAIVKAGAVKPRCPKKPIPVKRK